MDLSSTAAPAFDNWDSPTKVQTMANTNSATLATDGVQMSAGKVITITNVKPAPGNLISIEVFYKGAKATITDNASFIRIKNSSGSIICDF